MSNWQAWLNTGGWLIALGMAILAYIESKSKRRMQNGNAAQSFMNVAASAGKRLEELEAKFEIWEKMEFEMCIRFRLSDPITVISAELRPSDPLIRKDEKNG